MEFHPTGTSRAVSFDIVYDFLDLAHKYTAMEEMLASNTVLSTLSSDNVFL